MTAQEQSNSGPFKKAATINLGSGEDHANDGACRPEAFDA